MTTEPVNTPSRPVHGTRSRGSRHPETSLAWVISVAVHLLVLAIAFLVTWSVVGSEETEVPNLISAPLPPPTFQPVTTLERTVASTPDRPVTSVEEVVPQVDSTDLADLLLAADDLLEGSSALDMEAAGESSLPLISFGGVAAPAARRIVFVVDASGSMIGAYPAVIEQIERSLRRLDPRQSFSLVLFRGGEADELPPRGRLRPATQPAIDDAASWLVARPPEGRSDPAAALRRAFSLDPEVVYLASTDITGAGVYEIDREDLFSLLEEINPRDGNGRREATIRCIQLLDEDRLGTLREIAREHGSSESDESGFAFIGRNELGLE
ncbi:MAG: hypothetical protein CBB69_001120 [Phycisphaera sp. TMED9]|nr:MAG: hypothetical protein CBB69_001120 [Phycisphaera sp. TMED9]